MAKRNDESGSMDAVRRVKLTEEQVAERGRALAEKLGVLKILRDTKKADAEKYQTLIDAALDETEALRVEILEGAEEKRQGELFVGEEEAKEILASVQERIEVEGEA
jgi:hypothetical protein